MYKPGTQVDKWMVGNFEPHSIFNSIPNLWEENFGVVRAVVHYYIVEKPDGSTESIPSHHLRKHKEKKNDA